MTILPQLPRPVDEILADSARARAAYAKTAAEIDRLIAALNALLPNGGAK